MRIGGLILTGALALAAQNSRTIAVDAVPGSLQFSAGGQTLSALARDNQLRTFDVATGKLLRAKKVNGGTVLAPGGRYLERGEDKKTVRVWDLTAERQLYLLSGVSDGRMALSPDGRTMATSRADDRQMRVIDTASGRQTHALPDGLGGSAALAFSPDGALLVGANYDTDVRVWKTASGELVKKIEELQGAMFAAEFSPDGRYLFMAGLDETVYVWNAKTFALERKLQGHGETISAMAVSPDGRTLVTGGFDVRTVNNPVKIAFWDLATGKMTRTENSPHRVVALTFSPDSQWVAMTSGEKSITLWKLGR